MFGLFLLSTGIFWTITYLLIIRQGYQDHTYGMPVAALCANLAWEFIFSFIYPSRFSQRLINLIWLGLDLIIFSQLLNYGSREFPSLTKTQFYVMIFFGLLTSFGTILFICQEFQDFGGVYAAFGQNLMMSILFIGMFFHRGSLRGQSRAIALCKLLGTGCASLAFTLLYARTGRSSVLLTFFYITILVYDFIYLVLLARPPRLLIRDKFDPPIDQSPIEED